MSTSRCDWLLFLTANNNWHTLQYLPSPLQCASEPYFHVYGWLGTGETHLKDSFKGPGKKTRWVFQAYKEHDWVSLTVKRWMCSWLPTKSDQTRRYISHAACSSSLVAQPSITFPSCFISWRFNLSEKRPHIRSVPFRSVLSHRRRLAFAPPAWHSSRRDPTHSLPSCCFSLVSCAEPNAVINPKLIYAPVDGVASDHKMYPGDWLTVRVYACAMKINRPQKRQLHRRRQKRRRLYFVQWRKCPNTICVMHMCSSVKCQW